MGIILSGYEALRRNQRAEHELAVKNEQCIPAERRCESTNLSSILSGYDALRRNQGDGHEPELKNEYRIPAERRCESTNLIRFYLVMTLCVVTIRQSENRN